jgi:hypothetical protein
LGVPTSSEDIAGKLGVPTSLGGVAGSLGVPKLPIIPKKGGTRKNKQVCKPSRRNRF